jgi:hypothetical protein
MSRVSRYRLIAALISAAAISPSVAYARFDLNPMPAPTPSGHVSNTSALRLPKVAVAAHDFEWGDAGIGAAGMLTLLSIGAGTVTVVARRRRSYGALER